MTYANITLRGPDQKQVLRFLDKYQYEATVSPNDRDIVVIYPHNARLSVTVYAEYDGMSIHSIESSDWWKQREKNDVDVLAAVLSAQFRCTALAVHVLDDSVLYYHLFSRGDSLDTYIPPRMLTGKYDFETQDYAIELVLARGGDANVLCKALGAPDRVSLVARVLQEQEDGLGHWLLASYRHEKLVAALGLPDFTAFAVDGGNGAFRETKALSVALVAANQRWRSKRSQ